MKIIFLLLFAAFTSLFAPAQTPTPDQLWGPLFVEVQLKRVLKDNKSFVDAVPKYAPGVIMERYHALREKDSASLAAFLQQFFHLPEDVALPGQRTRVPLHQHLVQHWNTLTRKADKKIDHSSLLPLPHPYVVPGGRFREIYYWDSYFTMLGLAASNRYDLIQNMLDNFSYLINNYGHIPNGNRNYYLSRSQPPYFALMVQLLAKQKGKQVYKKYLPAMEKEYSFWMEGEKFIKTGEAYRRLVRLNDSTILNRYFDDSTTPRQESYYEDIQTGLAYQHKDEGVYRHLRAAAESGWDFSSRWFSDTFHLTSIQTTHIIPVDLNCLLYTYENILGEAYAASKQAGKSKEMKAKAARRAKAINSIFWSEEKHFYFDHSTKDSSMLGQWSLAGIMPLFANISTKEKAIAVADHIGNKFLRDGGVVTTLYQTGEQWDAPNGWPPLQYVTIIGLANYGQLALADTIARRWMRLNEKVYEKTGKMMEKYNVENINLEGGGGEYPTQDGFGWTNGVYLELHRLRLQ